MPAKLKRLVINDPNLGALVYIYYWLDVKNNLVTLNTRNAKSQKEI